MSLDYGAILNAGRQLVPDIRVQSMQDQAFQTDQAGKQLELQQAQEQLRQQQEMRPALEQALLTGHPQDILKLMTRFPKMAEQLKPVYQAIDAQERQTNMTQMGTIYARAQAGDYKGAADVLDQRIEADRAAGQDTAVDEQILQGLQSDDPVHRTAAMGTVGMSLAAASGPDHFAETYGKLNPHDSEPSVQKEAEYYHSIGRDDLAKQVQESTADPLVQVTTAAGTSIMPRSVAMSGGFQSKGGDPSSAPEGPTSATGYALPVPNGKFTSGFGAARPGGRSHDGLDIAAPAGTPVTPVKPGKVVAVGNSPDSGLFVRVKHADGTLSGYGHLAQQSVKVGDEVGPGTPLGTVGTTGNATGPVLHLVIRDPKGRAVDPRPLLGGAPVRVTTLQQAQRLPKGSHYIIPDGREFVR